MALVSVFFCYKKVKALGFAPPIDRFLNFSVTTGCSSSFFLRIRPTLQRCPFFSESKGASFALLSADYPVLVFQMRNLFKLVCFSGVSTDIYWVFDLRKLQNYHCSRCHNFYSHQWPPRTRQKRNGWPEHARKPGFTQEHLRHSFPEPPLPIFGQNGPSPGRMLQPAASTFSPHPSKSHCCPRQPQNCGFPLSGARKRELWRVSVLQDHEILASLR